MSRIDIEFLFLQSLKASLTGSKVSWEGPISEADWLALFHMAEIHRLLPMIYDAVYDCPAARQLRPEFLAPFKKRVVQQVLVQTIKTNDFLQLNRQLQAAGIRVLVVKGLACRALYPEPDYRMSGDEDLLVDCEQFMACHEVMLDGDMYPLEADSDRELAYEIPYGRNNSPLYIELHKSLFPPESEAYGDLNRFFEHVFERAVPLKTGEDTVYTMGATDHLFYLICHALKHFLHSGFGIRQVCDITLYANAHGKDIDWSALLAQCREIHAEQFAAALFRIGKKYLTFSAKEACYPEEWKCIRVDETDLLEDLLSGGVYGTADMSRRHSSTITLHAVTAKKKGQKLQGSVRKTVFPSARDLEKRYPYLKKYSFLLPLAWTDRLLKYWKETAGAKHNSAAESVRIGNRRIELLKKYGII